MRIANTYPQHMILWRNIENYHFIILILILDFSYFNYMRGANLGSLLYGDASVMYVDSSEFKLGSTSYSARRPWGQFHQSI